MGDLNDRVSLVTGAAQGIGKAIALELAARGAGVAVADVQKEAVEQTAAEIERSGSRALPVVMNVTDLESVKAAVKLVIDEFGQIDHLINNAGITRDNLIMRMKKEEERCRSDPWPG